MKKMKYKVLSFCLAVASFCGVGCSGVSEKVNELVCQHDYIEVVTKQATCGEEGAKKFVCEKCNSSKEESIPRTEHMNVIETLGEEPTCTTHGQTAGSYCGDCGTILSGEELPLKEHKCGEIVYLFYPTYCYERRYAYYPCLNEGCDYEEFYTYFGDADSKSEYGSVHTYGADGKCTYCGAVEES